MLKVRASFILNLVLGGLLLISIMYLFISYIDCQDNYNVDLWEDANWNVEETQFQDFYVPKYIEIIETIAQQYDSNLDMTSSSSEAGLLVSLSQGNIIVLFEFYNETFYGKYRCVMYNFGEDFSPLIESSQYEVYYKLIADVNRKILFSSVGTYDSFTITTDELTISNNFSGYSYYNDSMIGSVGYSVRFSDHIEKHYTNLLDEAGFMDYNRKYFKFNCSGILDPDLNEF